MGLITIAFSMLPPQLSAAEAGLRESLGPERFKAFGLSRLTAEELAQLEAWLAAGGPDAGAVVQQAAPAGAAAAEPATEEAAEAEQSRAAESQTFGNEQLERERWDDDLGERIQARIQGPFEGWEGKTLFRLDNGQIWRQRIGGSYRYRADGPAVEIVKGRFGYYLELLETGRQIGVRRVR